MTDDSSLGLTDRLPFLINRVGAALAMGFAAEALAERQLTIPIYRVLSVLSDHGPLRQVDVTELTSIESSTLSRLIGRIARRGLVSRTRSRNSNREVMLRLTPRGAAILEPLRAIGLQFDALAVEGLSPKEIETLKRYLRHVYRNIETAQKERRFAAIKKPARAAKKAR